MSGQDADRPPDPARSSAATIARILAGAEAEFGTKGLDGARIDDIARAAGISKQLIYHYFNGKGDLYSEMLLNIAQRNMELLSAIDYGAMSPRDAVRAFFDAIFRVYRDNPFASMLTVDQGLHSGAQVRQNHRVERGREELYRRLEEVLRRGQAAGELRADIDVAAIHFLAVVLVTGSLSLRPMFLRYTRQDAEEEGVADNAALQAEFMEFFMRALQP